MQKTKSFVLIIFFVFAVCAAIVSGAGGLGNIGTAFATEADPDHSGWAHEGATALTSDYLEGVSYQLSTGCYYLQRDGSGKAAQIVLADEIKVTGEVEICLNGCMITADNSGNRVFHVQEGGTLTLYSCRTGDFRCLFDPDTNKYEWELLPTGSASTPVVSPGLVTGGLLNPVSDGESSDLSGDRARSGGGIYVAGGGSLILQNGEISGNQADAYGGGVFVDSNGSLTMLGGKITGNASRGNGAGVYLCPDAEFELCDGLISDNTAVGGYEGMPGAVETSTTGNGGGIYNNQGTLTVSGGTVSENTARKDASNEVFVPGNGGGIYNQGTLTVSGGTLSGNTAEGNGAGIYQNDGRAAVEGGFILDGIARGENSALSIQGGYYPASVVDTGQNLVCDIALDTALYRLMVGTEIQASDPDYADFLELLEGESGYAVYKKGVTRFELEGDENIVYDGQPLVLGTDFSVKVYRNDVLDDSAVISCLYSSDSTDGTDGSFSDQPLINAGVGWLKISVEGSKIDYEQKAYYDPAEGVLPITVGQAVLTDETQDLQFTYDGQPHGPEIVLSGFVGEETLESAGGKIEYSLTGEGGWSETPAMVTHVADSREIFYRVSFQNYQTVTGSCQVTVTQAIPDLPSLPTATVTCGESLESGALSEGWTWAEGGQQIGAEDPSAVVYYALGSDHVDYDWAAALEGREDLRYDGENARLEYTVSVGILHDLTYYEELAATCTESGHVEYWHCETCQLDFGDEEGKSILEQVTVAPQGHQMEFFEALSPTCSKDGHIAHWHCKACEKNFEDEQGETELAQVTIAALGHELEHFEALSPTCTKDGNVEYWRCSVCGEAFEDGEGVTALEDVSIPALGHTWEHHEALPATCTEDGVVEYWHCTVCGLDFADEAGNSQLTTTVDPATGHQIEHHAAQEATDEAAGNTEYWACESCGTYFSDPEGKVIIEDRESVVLPRLTHTVEIIALIAGGVVILILAVILGGLIKEERRIVR